MSLLKLIKSRHDGTVTDERLRQEAITGVNALIQQTGSSLINAGNSRTVSFELESADHLARDNAVNAITELKGELSKIFATTIFSQSDARTAGDSKDKRFGFSQEQIEYACESAAYAMIASANPQDHYAVIERGSKSAAASGTYSILPMDGEQRYDMESFDPMSVQKYLAATAVAVAQAAVLGSFEDVWFPRQLIPAGQTGVDCQVTIPRILRRTPHTGDGSAPYVLEKTSIIDAVFTPDVLETEATTIVPYASDATTPAALIPNSVVPTFTKTVLGTVTDTRPILFGQKVDLIKLSQSPTLLTTGTFDETDSLDPVMNIGTLYYELTLVTGSNTQSPVTTQVVVSQDVSGQPGTLLTQVPQGKNQEFQTTANVLLYVRPDMTVVSGSLAGFNTALTTVLGIGAAVDYTLIGQTLLTARADTELGNFFAAANGASVTAYYDANKASASIAALSATGVSLTITPLGYYPQARRTNSNLRQNGTIIDANTTVNYRFPVNLQPPIITQNPIGASNMVTMDGLNMAARLRTNGRMVKALDNMEQWLQKANGMVITGPAQAPILGAEYVTPTYVKHSLDVRDAVTTMNSKDNIQNLRGQLTAAMIQMASQALVQSRYLGALGCVNNGDMTAFEVIVVCDPRIAVHLMESGDIRTLGDNRRYIITQSNNLFFTNKLYFTFRLAQRPDSIHPLDFGRLLETPPLTYEVQINRDGRTNMEVHTVPRANAYVTLPILCRLDVSNLETLYVTQ